MLNGCSTTVSMTRDSLEMIPTIAFILTCIFYFGF